MSSLPRVKASPALLPRALVSFGALVAIGWAAFAYGSGAARAGPGFATELLPLAFSGALPRRYGIPLPGNGFSSYVLGVVAYALLDRGWAFATLLAPLALLPGDLLLRRLPPRAAFGNAVHLAAGTALAGLLYARLGGALGADALGAHNLPALAAMLLVLPVVINRTFYLELALGAARAWVDLRLTARWEGAVYTCSALLALGWLRLVHADLGAGAALPLGIALTTATVGSLSVMRRAVRADELQLVQGLSQAIAADINLARSFGRIQELTRRLVPWEQMGFARYDAQTNEMALIADTALPAGERSGERFAEDGGLTGEAVGLGRPVVPRKPRRGRPGPPRGGDSRERRRQRVRRAEATRRRSRGGGGTDAPGRGPDGADHGPGPPGDPRRGAAADRPRRDDRGERERSAPPAGCRRAGGAFLGDHRVHRQPDQPARSERDDRGGARRRARPRLRRRRGRGPQARRGERAGGAQRRQVRPGDPAGARSRGAAARAHPHRPGRGGAELGCLGARPRRHRRGRDGHGAVGQAGRGAGARHRRAGEPQRAIARAGAHRRPVVHSGGGDRRRSGRRAAARDRGARTRRH